MTSGLISSDRRTARAASYCFFDWGVKGAGAGVRGACVSAEACARSLILKRLNEGKEGGSKQIEAQAHWTTSALASNNFINLRGGIRTHRVVRVLRQVVRLAVGGGGRAGRVILRRVARVARVVLVAGRGERGGNNILFGLLSGVGVLRDEPARTGGAF